MRLIIRFLRKINKRQNIVSVILKANSKYYIETQNVITCIHENKGNKRYEFNLLHDILNPLKPTKNLNSH